MGSDDDEHERSAPAEPDGSLTLGGRHGLGSVLSSLFGTEVVPEVFGRYRIVRRLGAGAFGEVYEATDSALQRSVAIKILRSHGSAQSLARLRREARAMAAVDDPALVEVFEVGTIDGRDFIAMELVRGTTLARWSEEHPPGTRERFAAALQRLLAAARGLHAAHARGLVHRDFKPANVLVTDDGVAKVADFGLARADDETAERDPDATSGTANETLTRSGTVMGTPRYMAPEQHHGRRADARSDQFALAVTAWEVVFATPPFVGATSLALLDAIERGPPVAPAVAGVPAWFVPVVQRAFAVEPAARYESVEALVRAIERAARRRRSRAMIAVACASGLGLVGWIASVGDRSNEPRCDHASAATELDSVWNEARRDTIAAGFRATDLPWADATGASLDASMQRWGERWIAQHVAACRATWHSHSASEAVLDRRFACLRAGLSTADALLDRLASPSSSQAERALAAVDGLPDPSECDAPEASDDGDDELATSVAKARAAHLAGDYAAAATLAREAIDAATLAGNERARGDGLFVLGLAVGEQTPGSGENLPPLTDAYGIAVALDHPRSAARRAYAAATGSTRRADLEGAAEWLRHAEVELARAPGSRVELEAGIARATCQLREAQGRLDDALVSCRNAVDLLERGEQSDPSQLWSARMSTASMLQAVGRYDEARTAMRALLDEAASRLGAKHPRVGGARMNLGLAAHRAGDHDEATRDITAAIEVFEATYGPGHAWVVSGWLNLASVAAARGDVEANEAALQRALVTAGERRDAQVARVLFNLADLRRRQGRFADAMAMLDRVADIEASTLGVDHIQTAHTHHARALVLLELGRLDEAAVQIDRVLALRRGSPTAPETATAWTVRARIELARGATAEALAAAREAERIFALGGRFDDTRAGNLVRWLELAARLPAGLSVSPAFRAPGR